MTKCALIFVALAALTAAASGRVLQQQMMSSMSPMMNGMDSSNMQMSNMPGGMAKAPMMPMMSGTAPMSSPMMAMSPMTPMVGGMTVATTAMSMPELSTFVAAIKKANLTDMLNNPNLMATVFAPTNDAFMAFMKMMNMTQEQLLNSYTLKPILQYHVVPNMAAMSANLTNMEMLPTMLSGNDLMVHTMMMNGMMSGVMIDGAASNATVTSANMMADKSIIHVVNAVLVPSTKTLDYYKPMAAST